MDVKLVLVIVVLVTLAGNAVDADIYFDRQLPQFDDKGKVDYKCIPGRTIIKIGEEKKENKLSVDESTDSESSEESGRRTHMNSGIKEEHCLICVCSLDGKEEHCSGRPARNVNECIRMSTLDSDMHKDLPYAYDRVMAYRIRRDYIWHYDEIPYESKAKCRRGLTYYSNNQNANDTSIAAASDVESLISYNDMNICFYCVCSVEGKYAGCISRNPWYCEYYRMIKNPEYARDRYANYFKQDRPGYFRSLSYRMRRRMDDGINALLDIGGDTLCCNHPNGHRRSLHSQVRNKIRQMRMKVPKENMLADSPHGDYVDFIVNND